MQTLDGGPDEGGTSDISTVGADGSEETFLTETGLETDPSWSPDASRIAFLSDPDLYGGVALMNADGSDLRIVFRGSSLGRPTWSPDGTALAFEIDSGIVNASANGLDPVTIVSGEAHNPAWAPDINRIAFDSPSQPDGPGIFIVALGSGAPVVTRLTTGDDHAPTWSPDGEPDRLQPGRRGQRGAGHLRGQRGRVRPHPADHRSGGRQPPVVVALGHRVTDRGSTPSTPGSRDWPATLASVEGD